MSALVKARDSFLSSLDRVIAAVKDADLDTAVSVDNRMKVAREMAKLEENAEELLGELLWLEALVLRRIGQLDAKALPSMKRSAARHFATLDEAELAKLIHDFPANTANACFRAWRHAEECKAWHTRGRRADVDRHIPDSRYIVSENRYVGATPDQYIDHEGRSRSLDVRQAVAIILDEYAEAGEGVTVSSVTDAFVAEHLAGADNVEASAMRLGVAEALRKAFAPTPTASPYRAPEWITAYDNKTGQWLRIPSALAKVSDAKRMIAYRRAQLADMTKAVDRLEGTLRTTCQLDGRGDDEWLRTDVVAQDYRAEHQAAEAAS